MAPRRFALLDRDGTVIVHKDYLSDPEDVQLIDGAADGLRQLADAGIGLAIVTNQSGVSRGYFDLTQLGNIHRRMTKLLSEHRVRLDGIFLCPHQPDDHCNCRKPRAGMVEHAVSQLNFEPAKSFVVGDTDADIGLGQVLGATTLLVRTGLGSNTETQRLIKPDFVVNDLGAAADIILRIVSAGNA